ncbi:MAG: RNA-directed polymerase [Sphingomonadales bacterium]|jgi:hypothetical protein|nr:RNA-directed polymerase [Sphingomonadales bacterium]
MRLPHHLVSSPFFLFEDVEQLLSALGAHVTAIQTEQIRHLASKGLPPIVSREALAVMLGVNSGLIWSFLNRPDRHYNSFNVAKGGGATRSICAPRVALKVVQKWLSYHLAAQFKAPAHVHGFVPGRSHISAAATHVGADWAFSVDLADFFPSTPERLVIEAYHAMGYDLMPARLLATLSTYRGSLPQGAPTSPALSNIAFRRKDEALIEIALRFDCKLTRYADDIVFSGRHAMPPELAAEVHALFEDEPWKLAPAKQLVQPLKGRIKVHGLLVQRDGIRLTKGYRNQIRAYSHVLATRGGTAADSAKLRGHVQYACHVAERTGSPSGIAWRHRGTRFWSQDYAQGREAAEEGAQRAHDAPRGLLQMIRGWFSA